MPTLLKDKKFEFVSQALPQDTFGVVSFNGSEGLSICYHFEIMLVANDPEIDLEAVLNSAATLTFLRDNGDIPIHGVLSQFEQLQEVNNYVFYRAVLSPKLWWLSLTHHNQVFLDKTIPGILEAVFFSGGMTLDDFEFKFQNNYVAREYVCQFQESHFDFVSRLMEHEGIYYYFEQSPDREKMILTDTLLTHLPMDGGKSIFYSPPSALAEPFSEEIIHALICKQKPLPGKLRLKDYNYRTPSLNLSSETTVADQGRGEVFLYGEHFRTTQEGDALANVRAQALLCHAKRFYGEGTTPFLKPGCRFELERHYRADFNQSYLTVEVEHVGNQTGFLISGIQEGLAESEKKPYYSNTFVALPANVQYRPDQKTAKPRFYGTIQARIDAEGGGEHAEIDAQGRYKVRLPFDINDTHEDGHASAFIRMVQPYAGVNYGFHFPLHKGVDVYLSFENGDPDRPVIVGSAPNPETISPVTMTNQTQSVVRDYYGNEMIFDATPGDEHIRIFSPHHKSGLVLGRSISSFSESDNVEVQEGNKLEYGWGTQFSAFAGATAEASAGLAMEASLALQYGFNVGGSHELNLNYGWEKSFGPTKTEASRDILCAAGLDNIISAGDGFCITGAAKKKDTAGGDVVKPILSGKQDEILFSLGKKFNVSSDSYYSSDSDGVALVIASSVAAAAAIALTTVAIDYGSKDKVGEAWTCGAAAMVACLVAALLSFKIAKDELADSKIEPAEHDTPPIQIKLQTGTGIALETFKPDATEGTATAEGSKIKNKQDGITLTFTDDKQSTIELKKAVTVKRNGSSVMIANDGKITIDAQSDIIIKSASKVALQKGDDTGFEFDGTDVKIKGKTLAFTGAGTLNKAIKWS